MNQMKTPNKPFTPRSAAGKYVPPEPVASFGDSFDKQLTSGDGKPTTFAELSNLPRDKDGLIAAPAIYPSGFVMATHLRGKRR
jgi:hypothetical protein